MQPFTDLKVWQRSHALVLELYRLSAAFPDTERFGLTSQLRRAATSAPSNIAEGSRRRSPRDFARFLDMAAGSLAETRSLLMLARDLGYAPAGAVERALGEADEISRMLNAFAARLDEEQQRPRREPPDPD